MAYCGNELKISGHLRLPRLDQFTTHLHENIRDVQTYFGHCQTTFIEQAEIGRDGTVNGLVIPLPGDGCISYRAFPSQNDTFRGEQGLQFLQQCNHIIFIEVHQQPTEEDE